MSSSCSSGYDSLVDSEVSILKSTSPTSSRPLAFYSNAHRLAYDTELCESDDAYWDEQTPLTIPTGRTMQSLRTVAWRWGISHEEAAELMQNVEDVIATPTPTPIFPASTQLYFHFEFYFHFPFHISHHRQNQYPDKLKVQKSTSFNFLPTILWFFQRDNTISS